MVEIKKDECEKLSFSAKSNGELLAAATGEFNATELVITSFTGEKFLFDGVCRAMLSWAEHNGAISCRFADEISDELLSVYGGKRKFEYISEIFFSHKCCQ